MVARRKPSKPKGYSTGGAVIPDKMPDDISAAGPDLLSEAVEAAKAAERPEVQFERYVSALDISEPKRQFLRDNPVVADPSSLENKAAQFYLDAARRAGMEEDSPEMFRHISDGIRMTMESERKMRVDMARHASEMLMPKPAPEPPPRMEEPEPAEPEPEPAPAPQPRKGIPMSAPVSRHVPSYGGVRIDNPITLTAEERQIAHTSMSWLPPREAERMYEQNKRKMLGMKERGEIQ